MIKTLEYTPDELVWILTSLESKPAMYVRFKQQFQADEAEMVSKYWVQLEMSTIVELRIRLLEVRRIFRHLIMNASMIYVPNLLDTTMYLVQSFDTLIEKVEALFND